jgi:adenylate cyclase
MPFRMGVNLGDVIAKDGTIYGDGVNIAARLEPMAEPGGIVIGESVQAQVKGKLPFALFDLGQHSLKNIDDPSGCSASLSLPPAAVKGSRSSPAGAARAAVDRGSAVRGSERRRPRQRLFRRRHQRGYHHRAFQASRLLRHRPQLHLRLQGQVADIRQVARELGVLYVLEGSVRKSGERLRVTAQLIDARTGMHLWAERYDRALSDIFAVQDEITDNVIGAIEPQLYLAENQRSRSRAAGKPRRLGLRYAGDALCVGVDGAGQRSRSALAGTGAVDRSGLWPGK